MSCACKKAIGRTFLVGALLPFIGCMTSPGHYEHVGDVSDRIEFSGYHEYPNREIAILAWYPRDVSRWDQDGHWLAIATARSSNVPLRYSGKDWYYWEVSGCVPAFSWTYLDGYYWADIRAWDVEAEEDLFTFEGDFDSYFDMTESLSELWRDHGHGTYVTIAADGGSRDRY
jgi:hypothetical protein